MDSIFKEEDGGFYTDADAVVDWAEARERGEHRRGFHIGDPSQFYRFTGETVAANGAAVYLFEAKCRVCEAEFTVSKTISQMKTSPAVNRNCSAHAYQSRPAPRGAWLRGSQLAAEEQQERERHDASAAPRFGVVQGEVLDALDTLDVVGGPVPASAVLRLAAKRAWRGAGKQDQRVKKARHALRSLIRRGVIEEQRIVW